jgi:phenylpyruvate tautomerase
MLSSPTALLLLALPVVVGFSISSLGFGARQRAGTPAGLVEDPICKLPGDPSLVVHTSASLGEEGKKAFLTAASKAVASCLSKPESYVAVCIVDGATMSFGGTTEPAALACLYSIGSINQPNNAALTKEISALLAPHGVPDDRIYINFFDVPRENCGWSGRTFAG